MMRPPAPGNPERRSHVPNGFFVAAPRQPIIAARSASGVVTGVRPN
jgi:hypothetical protein